MGLNEVISYFYTPLMPYTPGKTAKKFSWGR